MKTLKNIRVFPDSEDSKETYADLVCVCVSYANPQKGITIDEQRKRMRILEVVENATTPPESDMQFEDSDADLLKALVKAYPWGIVKKEIVQFGDAVEAMN